MPATHKMKRSMMVTLIISGALLGGCDDRRTQNSGDWESGQGQPITNNTYRPGYGYWHAPYHNWYPYPYNDYRPGFGYYHGGSFSEAPEVSSVTSSFSGHSASASARSSVTRGGFGSFGHGFSGRS